MFLLVLPLDQFPSDDGWMIVFFPPTQNLCEDALHALRSKLLTYYKLLIHVLNQYLVKIKGNQYFLLIRRTGMEKSTDGSCQLPVPRLRTVSH